MPERAQVCYDVVQLCHTDEAAAATIEHLEGLNALLLDVDVLHLASHEGLWGSPLGIIGGCNGHNNDCCTQQRLVDNPSMQKLAALIFEQMTREQKVQVPPYDQRATVLR